MDSLLTFNDVSASLPDDVPTSFGKMVLMISVRQNVIAWHKDLDNSVLSNGVRTSSADEALTSLDRSSTAGNYSDCTIGNVYKALFSNNL